MTQPSLARRRTDKVLRGAPPRYDSAAIVAASRPSPLRTDRATRTPSSITTRRAARYKLSCAANSRGPDSESWHTRRPGVLLDQRYGWAPSLRRTQNSVRSAAANLVRRSRGAPSSTTSTSQGIGTGITLGIARGGSRHIVEHPPEHPATLGHKKGFEESTTG